jgi:DNA polymerase III epsilon subunit family exonuclease
MAEPKPGIVLFHNYESLKAELERGLAYYNSFEYSVENIDIAIANRDELKKVKKILEEKKKEIEAAYTAPYIDVEAKLSELIDMVKLPFKIADDFIKSAEKEVKRREIIAFAKKKAEALGEYADKIIESPAFFNPKWLNATYRTKQWQGDIDSIVAQASDDIVSIQSMAGKNAPALLAHYYETLSMDRAKQFVESMREASECNELEGMDDDTVVGYKVLKIFASERQMLQLMMQMDMMGIDVEEIEDGMPRAMAELTVPNFDSFVAFDIEHTGTFGAAHGDAEAEIIEIGAVKVVNGIVVDKFDELCNPGRKIVPRIAKLTHITDSMVADKPSADEVIKQFKAFVGDSVLIGHNIKGCDIPHITRAARRAGVQFDNSYLDTKILAKKHKETHGWKNIKLTTLSEYFCITQTEAHRAWCDAEANAYVYLKLKEL